MNAPAATGRTISQVVSFAHIGILGGYGALAGARCAHAVMRAAALRYGAEQDHEFPPLTLTSYPTTHLDEHGCLPSAFATIADDLRGNLRTLADAGATVVGVACNTMHVLPADLAIQPAGATLVDLTDAVVAHTVGEGWRRPVVLGSVSIRTSALYDDAFRSAGLDPVLISDDEQDLVTSAILRGMRGEPADELRGVITAAATRGADVAVLACTDLAPIPAPLPCVDSLDVFASALLTAAAERSH